MTYTTIPDSDDRPRFHCCGLTMALPPQAQFHLWRVHGLTPDAAWGDIARLLITAGQRLLAGEVPAPASPESPAALPVQGPPTALERFMALCGTQQLSWHFDEEEARVFLQCLGIPPEGEEAVSRWKGYEK